MVVVVHGPLRPGGHGDLRGGLRDERSIKSHHIYVPDKDSCTKSVYKCIRKGMPLYTLRRRYYKLVRWILRQNLAPKNVIRRRKLIERS